MVALQDICDLRITVSILSLSFNYHTCFSMCATLCFSVSCLWASRLFCLNVWLAYCEVWVEQGKIAVIITHSCIFRLKSLFPNYRLLTIFLPNLCILAKMRACMSLIPSQSRQNCYLWILKHNLLKWDHRKMCNCIYLFFCKTKRQHFQTQVCMDV